MAKDKVTICLIGTGNISHVHAAGLNRCENVDLKCWNRTRSKAEDFARRFDVSEVVESLDEALTRDDIDGVDLCVTHDMHLEMCLKAFAAGKNVLLEKPMANTLAEADQMIAAAEKAGKILAVGENFRFEPALLKAKEIIDAGDIGKPFMITINDLFWMAETTTVYPPCDWRRSLKGNAGGVLYDRGVHWTAVINYLGGPIDTIYARCMNPQKYWEGDETSVLTITHKNGIVTNYTMSWNILGLPWRDTPLLEVFGTEGSIIEDANYRIDGHGAYEMGGLRITSKTNPDYEGKIIRQQYLSNKAWLEDLWSMDIPEHILRDIVRRGNEWIVDDHYKDYDVYHASVEDFVKAIRGEKAPQVTGQAARDDVAVVLAAYESNEKNCVVNFDEFNERMKLKKG